MFEQAFQQISIRHDVFSYLIAFGAFYGLYLAVLIFIRNRGSNNQANTLLGALLLCIGLALADLFLGYTGLMKYTIHLNDTTESLVLLMFPLVHLILLAIIRREKIQLRTHYQHFLIPVFYFLYEWLYFIQPREIKMNAHIGAFHQGEIDYIRAQWIIDPHWMWLKENFRLLIYLMGTMYLILGFRLVSRAIREGQLSLFKIRQKSKLRYVRNLILVTVLFLLAIIVVYFNYETDAGDHYIGVVLAYGVLAIGSFITSESRIFENAWIADKYETSGMASEHRTVLEKLRRLLADDPCYLQPDCSLKTLAQKLNIPANYLSQSINTELSQNFNEFINTYRIEAAQLRLLDPDYQHLNIEGIGNSVGFRSKSAFYAAFKKQTQLTPSQFVKQQRG
ncbi:helix-turn-helix domain-containing protein [Flavilitoribacter nigricans]|uniref:HTH araC/xylS-type domain-containing protein n=1 Tax=Flavilitoribacter nigricans (strain ATCC 23147 / DSM 23189 / NBRC 102662 / NCIMB 1420 / SS-2) TaxID=1122177 RepID=A0A2D0N3R1_FLAN2|nr:helix-turn-helix domain-containing protein [Flavilitoribacter nigricans]PHN03144.1 hypothetical protein CRP01_29130 [Flavilitoribacter nigricans DSM 23189 = NBRC 102662]